MEAVSGSLKEKWAELKASNPSLRIRNAAEELGVTEVELLATKCGEEVSRLRPEFANILAEVEKLGKVMALTRNNEVVHERKGTYLNPELKNPHVGLFVGEDIDLRIFFANWASVYAVQEESRGKIRKSIQFFAKDGEAVHKIYLVADSNEEVYDQLVKDYLHMDQSPEQTVEASTPKEVEKADTEIDVKGFQDSWIKLQDTHHFFGMLKKYGVTRTQALRLAPEGNYAVKVDNKALRNIITSAAEDQTPIMIFVGNQGMIQIHTGPVKKLLDHNEWFNIMDPDFNLHIKEPAITESWIVRKPSEDGVVTALECFNSEGEQIVQLFGKRKPGIPELESWRSIVAKVEENSILVS